jgi:hypothetical protein
MLTTPFSEFENTPKFSPWQLVQARDLRARRSFPLARIEEMVAIPTSTTTCERQLAARCGSDHKCENDPA